MSTTVHRTVVQAPRSIRPRYRRLPGLARALAPAPFELIDEIGFDAVDAGVLAVTAVDLAAYRAPVTGPLRFCREHRHFARSGKAKVLRQTFDECELDKACK